MCKHWVWKGVKGSLGEAEWRSCLSQVGAKLERLGAMFPLEERKSRSGRVLQEATNQPHPCKLGRKDPAWHLEREEEHKLPYFHPFL